MPTTITTIICIAHPEETRYVSVAEMDFLRRLAKTVGIDNKVTAIKLGRQFMQLVDENHSEPGLRFAKEVMEHLIQEAKDED